MASPYKIHLDTYDGPLDLLLDLIKKQEIDIHNIPIAKITGQYLDYLHKLEQLDMDISSDFIYIAATLIYIKSKMLLPPDPLAVVAQPRTALAGNDPLLYFGELQSPTFPPFQPLPPPAPHEGSANTCRAARQHRPG